MRTLLESENKQAPADIWTAERLVLEPGQVQVVGVPGSISVRTIEVVVRTGQIKFMPGDHRRTSLVVGGGVMQSRAPVALTALVRTEVIVRNLPH